MSVNNIEYSAYKRKMELVLKNYNYINKQCFTSKTASNNYQLKQSNADKFINRQSAVSFGSGQFHKLPNCPALKTSLLFAGFGTLIPHAVNMLGKATLTPAVILSRKDSENLSESEKKKSNENKRYAALLQPVEAAIEFASYAGINLGVSKLIDKNKDKLDVMYKNEANMKMLKLLAFTTVTMAAIPFVSKFMNWFTPKAVPAIANLFKAQQNINSDKKAGGQ